MMGNRSQVCLMGMIFVPSVNGTSHSRMNLQMGGLCEWSECSGYKLH
jgi:hypothetical protein